MKISQMVVFFLTEQQGTARNASLVKERVKIVPMKKGNLLLFYVTTDFRFLHPTVPNDILRNLMSVLCSSVVKMPKEKVRAVSAKTSTYSISCQCQRSKF